MGLTRQIPGALALLALAACSRTVEIRATQTCEGGNVDDCKSRCDNHEGMACYKLGWLHEEGQVVDHDFPRAKKLYEDACEARWPVACRALGDLYWKGEKVDMNRAKAIEYWQRACSMGLDSACPTQLERDVADGKLIGTVRDGKLSVVPNRNYKPSAPSVETPSAPNVQTPSAPQAPQVTEPQAPSVPQVPQVAPPPAPAAPTITAPTL